MNEHMNADDTTLPELSEARIDEIEEALFDEIARERRASHVRVERERRVRRGRLWAGGGAAAAVIAVAAVLAPSMPGIIAGQGSGSDSTAVAPDAAGGSVDGGPDLGRPDTDEGAPETTSSPEAQREIIASASATVRVDDVAQAAETIGGTAQSLGGYVEAMSIGAIDAPVPIDGREDTMSDPAASGAWVTIRVPASALTQATDSLRDLGEVTASQIDRHDVTGEAVDLRARVDALQASVARLTDLVASAESTADLIAAEEALSSRQADLEAYQQQLKQLDEQVAMSTLTVTLTQPEPVATADPAGFGDGLAAGWSGLVATLNGIVVALGFLLPWLAVLAVAGIVAWLVRRAIVGRRRGAQTPPTVADDDA